MEMESHRELQRAHTPAWPGGPGHLWKDHAKAVSQLARSFGEPMQMGDEAEAAGWLHDLGKLGPLFQRRLNGLEVGVDHSSAGAHYALLKYQHIPLAAAIQGHHLGLQGISKTDLQKLGWSMLRGQNDRRLSSETLEELLDTPDWKAAMPPNPGRDTGRGPLTRVMLRTRMLFSCLVDADFLDTEAHFNGNETEPKRYRLRGQELNPQAALDALDAFMEGLQSKGTAHINQLRETVRRDCEAAAKEQQGIFTLTAPTGSGKTLAMLRFALLHAKKHGLRRIVLVLPYLNLIDEAASIYRKIFASLGEDYVLEDHSSARLLHEHTDTQDERTLAQLWAENWDAPIVVTTNVQFLESLHANRPGPCRKLHRLAQSVVLMDEVQTIPYEVTVTTLGTLANLTADYGTTLVFATATQPAFDQMDLRVRDLSGQSWNPVEVIQDVESLFRSSQRVNAMFQTDPIGLEELADAIATQPGTLAIVNLRKDAARLFQLLRERVPPEKLAHLSTNMVTEHRRLVLRRIREENLEKEGWLVATQCIEAGVDLDFCRGFRALGPLESITQAAGRVNRNGQRPVAPFTIFRLQPDGRYPDPGYRQAAERARDILGIHGPVLHDPDVFREYWKQLDLQRATKGKSSDKQELREALESMSLLRTAEEYKLIKCDGANIFVNVSNTLDDLDKRFENERLRQSHKETYQNLREEIERGAQPSTLKRLRRYAVTQFLSPDIENQLTPVLTRTGESVPGWFVVDDPRCYDRDLGLQLDTQDMAYTTHIA